MSTTLTYREVKTAIDNYAHDYVSATVTDKADLDIAVEAISLGDRTVRDYIMGLPVVVGLPMAGAILSALSDYADKGNLRHFITPLSQFAYEAGETVVAYDLLDTALAEESDYNLARLLKRCYTMGWTADGFSKMRESVHPKVSSLMESDETLNNY